MSFIQNLFNRPSDSPQTELWPASGIHQPVNPAEEEAFAAHCQKRIARSGRIGAALALGVTLGWWPLDLLIYRNVVEAQGPPFVFRFSITASAIFFLLLPHRNPWVLRHVFWLLLLPVCCIMVGLGYSGGFLGGLGKPWSYLALPTMCATMMFPLPFRLRLVMTGAQGLSWVAGLLLFFPSNLRSPYLAVTISILVLVIVYSMLMGHYMTVLLRDNFRQSLALARNAEELEQKVAEKTQTLRDLLNKLEKAREEERARISRDLHDELGQELTALRYALGLLTERFRRDPASIARNLGELDHLLQRTNRTARSLVGQLRPLILDDLGLKAAIEWLLQRSAERTGLTYEATLQGDDSQLDPELASTAFRIVQESLTNVVKHSAATRVEVRLDMSDQKLTLAIRDNGVGFDPDAASPPKKGVGLIGMRERALTLGAQLFIHSQPAEGTEVSCTFPMARPS